jgi:hypothetical protein
MLEELEIYAYSIEKHLNMLRRGGHAVSPEAGCLDADSTWARRSNQLTIVIIFASNRRHSKSDSKPPLLGWWGISATSGRATGLCPLQQQRHLSVPGPARGSLRLLPTPSLLPGLACTVQVPSQSMWAAGPTSAPLGAGGRRGPRRPVQRCAAARVRSESYLHALRRWLATPAAGSARPRTGT